MKIRKLELGRVPRIAVSVSDSQSDKLIRHLPVDILEIRVDQFKRLDGAHIKKIIAGRRKTGLPIIMTVRSKDEGGQNSIPDKVKLSIFTENISLADAVDIELRSPLLQKVVKIAKINNKMVIISWHNLKSTPSGRVLKGIMRRAKNAGAHLVKIAAKANNTEDVNRLMKFTMENRAENLITISLGGIGSISRLVFPAAGSLITFAYIDKPSGSGQMPLAELRGHLLTYYPEYGKKVTVDR